MILITPFLHAQKITSPYEWNWKKDGILTGAGLVGSGTGLLLIKSKKGISENKLQSILNKQENINFLDKWVAGKNSDAASKISDIPLALSFATTFVLLLDDETNDHTSQILGLYLESMAITGALYSITAGVVNRSRPYVYDNQNGLNRRLSSSGQRSFFSGHVAATTSASFFAAKVFQDFNPESGAIPYVWTGAVVLPAVVGYFRIQAGQHFLTDVLLGYGLGAAVGYFVPELHKVSNDTNIRLTPIAGEILSGDYYQGLKVSYTF